MGNAVSADRLVSSALGALGLPERSAALLFGDAPLDFPVRFGSTLPLGAHRRRMQGITLCGRVFLLGSENSHPPPELIVLLRHEAEHVRQQRDRPFTFYPRYALGWFRGILHGLSSLDAYRSIRFERDAYAAGARAHLRLAELLDGRCPPDRSAA